METFDFCFETVLDVADKHKKATDDEDGISHLARVTYEAEKAHIKKYYNLQKEARHMLPRSWVSVERPCGKKSRHITLKLFEVIIVSCWFRMTTINQSLQEVRD